MMENASSALLHIMADERKVSAMRATAKRFDVLRAQTARPDWGDEREEPIAPSTWDTAEAIAAIVSVALGAGAPVVSACGDASAHLQWVMGDDVVSVEVYDYEIRWRAWSATSGDCRDAGTCTTPAELMLALSRLTWCEGHVAV